jgi:parallel beta-helix repeat protein
MDLAMRCWTLTLALMILPSQHAAAVPTSNLLLTCSDPGAVGRTQNECNGTWSYQALAADRIVLGGSTSASAWARADALPGSALVAVCTLAVEPGQYSSCRDSTGVRRIAFIRKDSVAGPRATLHVENFGTDTPTCGAQTSPCRSITQAIANARVNDWIVVGPGRYGNLDQDAVVAETGEEGRDSLGCQCLVNVDKAVSIVSVRGASQTIIDARSTSPTGSDELTLKGVRIVASGVTFGAPGHGFTVTGTPRNTGIETGVVERVRIAGNIATQNAEGISLGGARNLLTNNVAVTNGGTGFGIRGNDNVVWRNTSIAQGDAFRLDGEGHVVLGNVASGNLFGVTVASGSHRAHRNSALGNASAGVRLLPDTSLVLRRNNFYGNGAYDWTNTGSFNCGILNEAGNSVDAAENFWGSSAGAGDDPADTACDLSGTTTVAPFAARQFEVAGADGPTAQADWAGVVRFLESDIESNIAEALTLLD